MTEVTLFPSCKTGKRETGQGSSRTRRHSYNTHTHTWMHTHTITHLRLVFLWLGLDAATSVRGIREPLAVDQEPKTLLFIEFREVEGKRKGF